MYRIGYGEDIHRLVEGRKLILGGVDIPFDKGLLGHSDADIVCHALIDALLGALSLGDIGTLFPNSDNRYKDANSLHLLFLVAELVDIHVYEICNIDVSISLEKPRLASYLPSIIENIAKTLKVNKRMVSVKAMTNEGCDAVGRGEAGRAVAIVMLKRK